MSIYDIVKRVTPRRLVRLYRRARYGREWFDPQGDSMEAVFSEVYRTKTWSPDSKATFDSGPGSDSAITLDYVHAVGEYIRRNSIQSVADLGCGDFRVGGRLLEFGITYHGVDVVPDLIAHLTRTHSRPGVQFSRRDLVADDLPDANLGLIRQVLQHLSNAQVATILAKSMNIYNHIIVTEHILPAVRLRAPNLDISHGPETRCELGSHLALDLPPFNYHVETLCSTALADGTAIISYVVRPAGTKPAEPSAAADGGNMEAFPG